ncbi:unnamed protein product [marine sediment metagenome]|uniref:Uncharacterized protein n=1 Tax=marine sediment metagenome TaxID=412755 RepID=X0U896_9ZZZZ
MIKWSLYLGGNPPSNEVDGVNTANIAAYTYTPPTDDALTGVTDDERVPVIWKLRDSSPL